jgi:hypothetical protein
MARYSTHLQLLFSEDQLTSTALEKPGTFVASMKNRTLVEGNHHFYGTGKAHPKRDSRDANSIFTSLLSFGNPSYHSLHPIPLLVIYTYRLFIS